MAIIGYRRVSTLDQRLDRQDLGQCSKVFEEHVSGKDRNRPELEACLAYLRGGDTLRVHSVDRLARSLKDLLSIVDELTTRGVKVEFLTNNLTFDPAAALPSATSPPDPYQVAMLGMLGVFAQLERDIIAGRRDEGIALAKQRNAYKGRATALKPEHVRIARQRRRDGVTVARLMADYGVSKMTMHRALTGTGIYSGPMFN